MDLRFDLKPSLEHSFERNREGFDIAELRMAQKRGWEAFAAIREMIRPGMLEEEARVAGEKILKDFGFEKSWHRLYVRFGENTLLKFGEPSKPDTRLGENDIYFLDIGPVWRGRDGLLYEGDVGDTVVVGNDAEMKACAEITRKLFRTVAEIWRRESLSGAELYARAAEETRKLGYVLHPQVDGHRAGDFPHQVFYKGGIGEIDFKPSAGIWILEIQIRHPTHPFGAFFEDTLE
jgi:Xaa-Pro aminopeptidase